MLTLLTKQLALWDNDLWAKYANSLIFSDMYNPDLFLKMILILFWFYYPRTPCRRKMKNCNITVVSIFSQKNNYGFAYSKGTYSVNSLILEYQIFNRWSDLHGVLVPNQQRKPCKDRMYSFREICLEVSLQNAYTVMSNLNSRIIVRGCNLVEVPHWEL